MHKSESTLQCGPVGDLEKDSYALKMNNNLFSFNL